MKALLLLLVISGVLIAATQATRGSRYRYNRRSSRYNRYNRYNLYNEEKEETTQKELDADSLQGDEDAARGLNLDSSTRTHPCSEVKCEAGQECDIDEDGKGHCQCITECPPEEGPRVEICTSRNVTFANECEFYRMRCLCQARDKNCEHHRYKNAHLDYYGACTEIKKCKEHEMKEFPKRMREWLFLIMEELDKRNTLSASEHDLVMEAKRRSNKWVLPVIWKFCDLDKTHDRSVSKDELVPITAPLKPLEHCTGPFLEKCDENDNGIITLEEWGSCLGLDPDEVRREDRCDALRD